MTYAEQMKEAKRRREEIVRLYRQKTPKLSLRQIGAMLSPPISGQRVFQHIRKEGVVRD